MFTFLRNSVTFLVYTHTTVLREKLKTVSAFEFQMQESDLINYKQSKYENSTTETVNMSVWEILEFHLQFVGHNPVWHYLFDILRIIYEYKYITPFFFLSFFLPNWFSNKGLLWQNCRACDILGWNPFWWSIYLTHWKPFRLPILAKLEMAKKYLFTNVKMFL